LTAVEGYPIIARPALAVRRARRGMKQRLVFALLMGILTTGIISCALVGINVGFGAGFVRAWLRSWGLAYVIVIPALVFLAPIVPALVDRALGPSGAGPGGPPPLRRRLTFALSLSVVTTAIISFTLVAVNVGLVAGFAGVWLRAWGLAYLAVVPAILFLAPWVQRRVDRMFARARSGGAAR
jgi:hypothetical protein